MIFGDGVFGRKLEEPDFITVEYNVSTGAAANGLSSFAFNGRLLDQADRVITSGISLITTLEASQLGSDIESVESIKKYSTRISVHGMSAM